MFPGKLVANHNTFFKIFKGLLPPHKNPIPSNIKLPGMQRRKPGSKIRRKINQYKHVQKDTDNTINIQGIKRAIMFSKQECGEKKE